jgi:hypothetical protein
MSQQSSTYIPGVCNINQDEIRKRRKIGLIGLAALLVSLAGLMLLKVPALVMLVLFLPAFLMAIGLLQAKNKFCVGYAAAGMRHTALAVEKIDDDEAMHRDKARARSMNLQALGIAIAIALMAVFIEAALRWPR